MPAATGRAFGAIALCLFSVVWMLGSWEEAAALRGVTKVNHLTQGLAGLLTTLLVSCALYGFWRHRSKKVGLVVGLATAIAALVVHRM